LRIIRPHFFFMMQSLYSTRLIPALLAFLLSLALAACGGGLAAASITASTPALIGARDSSTPRLSGDTATDGLNWINYRRQQVGVPLLERNGRLDTAAVGQSHYLQLNKKVTHVQTVDNPGFTGVTLADRLAASGFGFTQTGHAFGEVIAATGTQSGFNAADELVTAIYHRFVILEPMSKEAGAGAGTAGDSTYFTTDVAADGLDRGLGSGNFITYPAANQQLVPTLFNSDGELPDPTPGRNQVGFPVSIHADLVSTVNVQRFTIQPRGGAPLPVQLMTNANDPNTPVSAAAIIPLDILIAATTYDVRFVGNVDGVAVNRSWQFTTQ
jgi:uncharacterized protein YkwD